jgi:hypothetical protein
LFVVPPRLEEIMTENRAGERCMECGYTEQDAQLHMDHRLCKNAGNAPWEKRKRVAERGDTMKTNDVARRESYVLADEVAKVQREREHFKNALEQILRQSACNLARRVAERALQGKKAGF